MPGALASGRPRTSLHRMHAAQCSTGALPAPRTWLMRMHALIESNPRCSDPCSSPNCARGRRGGAEDDASGTRRLDDARAPRPLLGACRRPHHLLPHAPGVRLHGLLDQTAQHGAAQVPPLWEACGARTRGGGTGGAAGVACHGRGGGTHESRSAAACRRSLTVVIPQLLFIQQRRRPGVLRACVEAQRVVALFMLATGPGLGAACAMHACGGTSCAGCSAAHQLLLPPPTSFFSPYSSPLKAKCQTTLHLRMQACMQGARAAPPGRLSAGCRLARAGHAQGLGVDAAKQRNGWPAPTSPYVNCGVHTPDWADVAQRHHRRSGPAETVASRPPTGDAAADAHGQLLAAERAREGQKQGRVGPAAERRPAGRRRAGPHWPWGRQAARAGRACRLPPSCASCGAAGPCIHSFACMPVGVPTHSSLPTSKAKQARTSSETTNAAERNAQCVIAAVSIRRPMARSAAGVAAAGRGFRAHTPDAAAAATRGGSAHAAPRSRHKPRPRHVCAPGPSRRTIPNDAEGDRQDAAQHREDVPQQVGGGPQVAHDRLGRHEGRV